MHKQAHLSPRASYISSQELTSAHKRRLLGVRGQSWPKQRAGPQDAEVLKVQLGPRCKGRRMSVSVDFPECEVRVRPAKGVRKLLLGRGAA